MDKDDMAHLSVPTEKLVDLRNFVHKEFPLTDIRRFIVDCHNGISYSNIEFNLLNQDGIAVSDEDAINYLRSQVYKHNKCQSLPKDSSF